MCEHVGATEDGEEQVSPTVVCTDTRRRHHTASLARLPCHTVGIFDFDGVAVVVAPVSRQRFDGHRRTRGERPLKIRSLCCSAHSRTPVTSTHTRLHPLPTWRTHGHCVRIQRGGSSLACERGSGVEEKTSSLLGSLACSFRARSARELARARRASTTREGGYRSKNIGEMESNIITCECMWFRPPFSYWFARAMHCSSAQSCSGVLGANGRCSCEQRHLSAADRTLSDRQH